MHVSRVLSVDEIAPATWDQLVVASSTSTVFQLHAWQRLWWEHFGRRCEPLVLVAYDDDEKPVGIAPLAIRSTPILGRSKGTVTFAGVPNANYADFVVRERPDEVLGLFVDWLLCHRELWSSIHLSNVLNTSGALGMFPSLMRERGLVVRTRLKAEAPMLQLCGDPGTDARWTTKKDIRRNERRLRKEGDLTFQRLWDPDEMLALLPEFYRQHIVRHDQTSESRSQFLEEGQRRFLEESICDMAAVGRMGLDVLRLDGRPIAFQFFMIDVPPRSVILKMPSFDATYSRWSPGNVLLTRTLRNFADAGFNRIDFSSGEQRYKYRFTNHIRSVNSVYATTHPTRYWAVGVRWRIKDRLRDFRRRHPEQVVAMKRALRRASTRWRDRKSTRSREGDPCVTARGRTARR